MTLKRPRSLKLLAGMALILVLIPILLILWVQSVADRRLSLAEKEAARLRGEVLAKDLECSRLRQGSEDGNAWDEYLKACGEAARITQTHTLAMVSIGRKDFDKVSGFAIVEAHGIIGDHLHRGARRKECHFPGSDEQVP